VFGDFIAYVKCVLFACLAALLEMFQFKTVCHLNPKIQLWEKKKKKSVPRFTGNRLIKFVK